MRAVQRGDEHAFAQLVGRHVDALYNYATRLTGSRSFADDLVQETWLVVWTKASTYRSSASALTTWLHRILYNKFVDALRKNKFETEQLTPDNMPESATLVPDSDMAWLNTRLNHLPESQRAAILLAHAQGFGNKDIAQIMRTSVRAVESLLARARRTLRSAYEQEKFTNDE
ncbi:MAG: sigma-70 family RNA polymerase sigma factor [Pseudomonadales bacterium]|nr:sigma-70 family RNA polymerase sigma factor [Pseudomonadales bacterium]